MQFERGIEFALAIVMKLRAYLLLAVFTLTATISGTFAFADANDDANNSIVAVSRGHQIDSITTSKYGIIKLEQPELNPTAEKVYQSLTLAQKQKFDRTRLWLLRKLAIVLSRSDVQVETAYVENDKVRIEDVAGDVFERDDSSAKSRKRVRTILETMHNVLWQNPAAASAANEHGVMILIGLQAQLGLKSKFLRRWNIPEKAVGGAGFLGIQIGYNDDLKKAVIEFSYRTETLYSGAVTNVGQVLRIYPYMRSRSDNYDGDIYGRSSNPSSPPFMGYGFEYSPTYLSMGYNNSWFSLPGEWTAALYFVNEFHQRALLQLNLPTPKSLWSKFRKFFARRSATEATTCAELLHSPTEHE